MQKIERRQFGCEIVFMPVNMLIVLTAYLTIFFVVLADKNGLAGGAVEWLSIFPYPLGLECDWWLAILKALNLIPVAGIIYALIILNVFSSWKTSAAFFSGLIGFIVVLTFAARLEFYEYFEMFSYPISAMSSDYEGARIIHTFLLLAAIVSVIGLRPGVTALRVLLVTTIINISVFFICLQVDDIGTYFEESLPFSDDSDYMFLRITHMLSIITMIITALYLWRKAKQGGVDEYNIGEYEQRIPTRYDGQRQHYLPNNNPRTDRRNIGYTQGYDDMFKGYRGKKTAETEERYD